MTQQPNVENGAGDLGEVGIHRLGVGEGHDQTGGGGAVRADCAENAGRFVARVADGAGAGAALRPDPCQRALLTHPGFILEPDLERFAARRLGEGRRYRPEEVFLNASCSAGSAFGCCGRTDSRR